MFTFKGKAYFIVQQILNEYIFFIEWKKIAIRHVLHPKSNKLSIVSHCIDEKYWCSIGSRIQISQAATEFCCHSMKIIELHAQQRTAQKKVWNGQEKLKTLSIHHCPMGSIHRLAAMWLLLFYFFQFLKFQLFPMRLMFVCV